VDSVPLEICRRGVGVENRVFWQRQRGFGFGSNGIGGHFAGLEIGGDWGGMDDELDDGVRSFCSTFAGLF
jgi:hypothetical protein